jgi:hypothetical protein
VNKGPIVTSDCWFSKKETRNISDCHRRVF